MTSSTAGRAGDRLRRPCDRPADGAGDPAQRTPLPRPGAARPGFGDAAAERLLYRAAARPGARLRSTPPATARKRSTIMINGITLNDHGSARSPFSPRSTPFRSSRSTTRPSAPNTGTAPARSSTSRRAPAPTSSTASFRVPAQRCARRPQLLQLHLAVSRRPSSATSSAAHRRPILHASATFTEQADFLLLLLRGPAAAAGTRPQQPRSERRAARVRDRPGDQEADRLIPRANFIDSSGTPRFVGSATAPVNIDQWTIDISHNLDESDRLHGYYAIQHDERSEPNLQGNTIPGFGDTRHRAAADLTLNETHTFGPALVNEARFGFNRIYFTATPNAQLNPADFGIHNGINEPIGLPQINIAGGSLNFGGPVQLPAGARRHDLCRLPTR